MLSVNEIMAQVIKEKKISQKQFEEAMRKKKESFNGLVENPDILAHFVATDYGVMIELDEKAKKGEVQTVKMRELLSGKFLEKGRCTVRGYVLNKRDSKTKKGNKPIIFVTIMDDTGTIDVMIYDSEFEKWSDIPIKSLVELRNISIYQKSSGERGYSFGKYSELSKLEDKSFPPLDSLIKDVLNDEKPTVAMKCRANGIVWGVDYTPYDACNVCYKSTKNCECSEKTNIGVHKWTNIRMTNGRSATIVAKLSERNKIENAEQLRGTQLNVIGMYDPKNDEIIIDSYEVKQRFDKPHPDFFVNKEKLKKISEDTAKFVGIWGASGVPYDNLCAFLESPRFECSKEQARDVIERLVGDGLIKRDGINVVLAKEGGS